MRILTHYRQFHLHVSIVCAFPWIRARAPLALLMRTKGSFAAATLGDPSGFLQSEKYLF